jgi:anti-sigma B factor antagonist
MQLLDRQSEVTVLEQNRRLVARITADITIRNSAPIRTAILSAWEERGDPEAVILDLGDVRHIDSSGVGALLELANQAKKAGIPFSLCNLQESPRRLLDRTGLYSMFQVYATVGEAMLGLPTQTGNVEPNTGGKTMQDTIQFNPSGRRRDLPDEDEQSPTHSHRMLGALTVLTLAGVIAAGAYGYRAIGGYRGKLNLLPAMQNQIVAAGRENRCCGRRSAKLDQRARRLGQAPEQG